MANVLDRITNGRQRNAEDQRDEPLERMLQGIYTTRQRNTQLETENAELRNALESERTDRKIADMQVANLTMLVGTIKDLVNGNPPKPSVDLSSLASRIGEIGNELRSDASDNGVYDTEEPR